jgi:mannose-6-phosphate isomerase-like protein (cupin superfamily)
MYTFKVIAALVGFAALTWIAACIVDRMRPEPPAPESFYPAAGQVLHSRTEGFTSRVLKTDREHTWLELTMSPHAPGPPPHVHTTFAEDFIVAKGTLSLRVGDEVKVLHPGENFRVPPGVVHQPFNATDEEVVVSGPLTPEYALPRDFVLFLSQVYGFIDEAPEHAKPPAILFQKSLFEPLFDAWMPSPPIFVQRMQNALLRPIARLLGYRSYYARFAPKISTQPN